LKKKLSLSRNYAEIGIGMAAGAFLELMRFPEPGYHTNLAGENKYIRRPKRAGIET
jgi:hypothetical protein